MRIVKLAYVGLPVGSTSAFMAVLGHAFGVLDRLGPAGRAAAALGIYTDTSALLHGATPLDFKMFEVLTRDEETQDILDELRDYRVPPEWYVYKGAAFQNMEVTGAVRVAPIGYVREEHRDVIAEIANELLRIEGTSIGVSVAVTERGTEVSLRADSRLLGEQPARIVRVIDRLLETACPGVSGFKYQRRPPHRVEGGACLPLTEREEKELRPALRPPNGGGDVVLAHCRFVARMLVGSIQALKDASPTTWPACSEAERAGRARCARLARLCGTRRRRRPALTAQCSSSVRSRGGRASRRSGWRGSTPGPGPCAPVGRACASSSSMRGRSSVTSESA